MKTLQSYARLSGLLAMLSVVAGCASQPAVTEEEIDEAARAQAEWFQSLASEQPVQAVLVPVMAYQQSSFEVLAEGVVHQYVQGQFPLTRVLFGLYFKDGLLRSLILDQQVGDFGWCRVRSYATGHWLAGKRGSFSSWLQENNRLGDPFDPAMRHPPIASDRMSAADVVEAATYLPVIAVALPLYGMERLAGGSYRDARQRKLNRQLMAKAMGFQLGQTKRDDVLRALGSADEVKTVGETEVWRYRGPGIWVGMLDGVVMWKESGSLYAPRNSAVDFSRNCADALGP